MSLESVVEHMLSYFSKCNATQALESCFAENITFQNLSQSLGQYLNTQTCIEAVEAVAYQNCHPTMSFLFDNREILTAFATGVTLAVINHCCCVRPR